MVYPKSFIVNNFILQDDGMYKATLLATTHGLGINYHVTKMIVRNAALVDVNITTTGVTLTSDEAFEGYILLV